ncbi:30S ribosomal protein S27e [Candidatus Pacearchaeota archaeon]|nr:30S ribosomal protein S27e [Candidatus Pacearchaeota archaeon]
MKKPLTSKFLKISCPRCKSKQIIFGKSSNKIKCLKCNYLLLKTMGGKAKIYAPVKEVL